MEKREDEEVVEEVRGSRSNHAVRGDSGHWTMPLPDGARDSSRLTQHQLGGSSRDQITADPCFKLGSPHFRSSIGELHLRRY